MAAASKTPATPASATATAAAASSPEVADTFTPISALLIGTGEYTTGFGKESSKSDKATGVVLPSILQMRKEGLIGDVSMAGTSGGKVSPFVALFCAAAVAVSCFALLPRLAEA